jgi:hypothetical protein
MGSKVVYVSEVKIERDRGTIRRAWLPSEDEPVIFSVHSGIARHYRVNPAEIEPHAATLDYLVAATGG